MPFHHIPEKSRIVAEFGTGDININTATQPNGEKFVLLVEQSPQEIGTDSNSFNCGDECDDYKIGLFFTKPQSIDALISVLEKHKSDKFHA